MLPPIAVKPQAEDEIHLLCGHSHVPLGCFALWSFLRWVRFDVAVYVHSDGTLDDADRLAWSSVFPNINIVSKEQSAAAAAAFFTDNDLPLVKRLAAGHVYGKKVLDIHLFGTARRMVSLDTDILFFRKPRELLALWEEVRAGRRGIISTFDDNDDFYVSDRKTVAGLIGSIPERFNSGMCILEKFGPSEFKEIERILQAFANHEPDLSQHLWVEQTIYAVMAGRRTPYRMSSDYQLGGALGDPVAVHYAGLYRELFYTEGIPKFVKSMQ